MLLLGIWVGKGHPSMNTYLAPLVDQLVSAETHGFYLMNEFNVEFINRIAVVSMTADMKAKVWGS
jgi:hypothetical protein